MTDGVRYSEGMMIYACIDLEAVPAPRPVFRIAPVRSFAAAKKAGTMRALLACFRPVPSGSKTHTRYKGWKSRASKIMESATAGMKFEKDVPVRVEILVVGELPKSHHRKTEWKKPSRSWLTSHGKGDVDNLAKGVLDAANGIVFEDDRQVVSLTIEKVRGAQGEDPRVEFRCCEARPIEEGTEFETVT